MFSALHQKSTYNRKHSLSITGPGQTSNQGVAVKRQRAHDPTRFGPPPHLDRAAAVKRKHHGEADGERKIHEKIVKGRCFCACRSDGADYHRECTRVVFAETVA